MTKTYYVFTMVIHSTYSCIGIIVFAGCDSYYMDDTTKTLTEARINFMTTSQNKKLLMVINCSKNESKWQTIQQRVDNSVNFMRPWEEYVNGFGHPNGNYWMGLEKMHQLTKNGKRLRIMLLSFNLTKEIGVIIYDKCIIGDSESNYDLKYGKHVGNVGNSLVESGYYFSALDIDNDYRLLLSCCNLYNQGGWWMNNCGNGMLNGIYWPEGTDSEADYGIFWWKYEQGTPLRGTIMAIN